jgi:ribosome-binding factor A
MAHRVKKVESLIRNEISEIFVHKLQDPAFGILTITDVSVSPDLRNAKVYLSVYDREKRDEAIEKARENVKLVRTELAKRVRLRHVPELAFYIDDTADNVERIESLLKEIKRGKDDRSASDEQPTDADRSASDEQPTDADRSASDDRPTNADE